MNGSMMTLDVRSVPEVLAAELTDAAYSMTLRRGLRDQWLDLELALWHALGDAIEKWGDLPPFVLGEGNLTPWQEDFLAELTEAAYRTALRFGVRGSFLEIELGLHRAFRAVVEVVK